jgi:ATP-dependent DNA helicase RecG
VSEEGQRLDKKSLRALVDGIADLAKDCVGFANARGGRLLIGIEDDADDPPPAQRVKDSDLDRLAKRISQITLNVAVAPVKEKAGNGGEYIRLEIFPNAQGIAAMSDGRYFIRVADETRPLLPDELGRLMNDRGAFVWETHTSQAVPRSRVDGEKLRRFLELIRSSERVSAFVKGKADDEILDYYLLAKGDHLTNLGVLWLGTREDRATLSYAPVIQFIKYDETGRKVNKIAWDDFSHNPQELIEAVLAEVPDWQEYYELPEGTTRKTVPHYDEVVIRELLGNSLAHRPYTQRGDIFLMLHSDRLEVHNPGLLPLGVTPRNILHTSVKRNEHLAKVFYDLKLMEREGSGYDAMYDVLLSSGKQIPEVAEGEDRVTVTVWKRIVTPAVINFVARADELYRLTQKERITLGLLAQHGSMTITELTRELKLNEAGETRRWLGRLVELAVVKHRGRTKGKEYLVEPDLLRKLNFKGKTGLKAIEPHRLRELILSDLRVHGPTGASEVRERIGPEISARKIYREIQELVGQGEVEQTGAKRGRKYLLTKSVRKN